MPLRKGSSDAVVRANIRKLIHEGRPPKQAVAIAYRVAGRTQNTQENPLVDHTLAIGLTAVGVLAVIAVYLFSKPAAAAAPSTTPTDTTTGSLKIVPKNGDMGRITVPHGRMLSVLMPAEAVTGSVSPNPETILKPVSNLNGQIVLQAAAVGFGNILVLWTDVNGTKFQASLGVSVV